MLFSLYLNRLIDEILIQLFYNKLSYQSIDWKFIKYNYFSGYMRTPECLNNTLRDLGISVDWRIAYVSCHA